MSESLNYDELNKAWKAIEDRIASSGCPYETEVDAGEGRKLAWMWSKGSFRICVIQNGDHISPVLDSKFHHRIELVEYVESLEKAIIPQLSKARHAIDEASRKLNVYLASSAKRKRG